MESNSISYVSWNFSNLEEITCQKYRIKVLLETSLTIPGCVICNSFFCVKSPKQEGRLMSKLGALHRTRRLHHTKYEGHCWNGINQAGLRRKNLLDKVS
jgi:hypothetical protein